MRRSRGFTLVEIMVAVGLTSIVMAAVLSIVRVQLHTFEQNDQVVRTQQNARATLDFMESVMRRACGGVTQGAVAVNVPGIAPGPVACVRFYDGATVNDASFATGSVSSPDAIEVIYGSGKLTATSSAPVLGSTSLPVNDVTGFSQGDYVLVTDPSYLNGYLFQVSAVPTPSGTYPQPGTLTLGAPGGTFYALPSVTAVAGMPVLKAATYSFYVSTTAPYTNMLMVDTNGVASTTHLTGAGTTVQPLVEGVVDLQIAIGIDSSPFDGIITENLASPSTDEWVGNASGETLPTQPWTTPWITPAPATNPQLRQIRISLTLQTLNQYPGALTTLTAYEDRPAASYPISVGGTANPKYRSDRITVAPRAWNLAE